MKLFEKITQHCRQYPKSVVFTDVFDQRVIEAARYLSENQLAHPLLLGGPVTVREFASKKKQVSRGLKITSPTHDREFDRMSKHYAALDSSGSLTFKAARDKLKNPLIYAAMLAKNKRADVVLSGNSTPTTDVLRTVIQLLGCKNSKKLVSGCYLMYDDAAERLLAFADCTVIPRPTAQQLAQIAVDTADKFEKISGIPARIAMLSFSTAGSADHPLIEHVRAAIPLVREMNPSVIVDGEIQFDAAFVPRIAAQKAPKGLLQGQADVFVFPSLNAANIGCKIAEHIGGLRAVGTLLNGIDAQFYNLSPGCSVQSIIDLVLVGSYLKDKQ